MNTNTTTTVRTNVVRTFALAATLSALLTASSPLMARESAREPRAPRDRDAAIVRIVKTIIRTVFGVSVNESITIPKP